MKKVIIQSLLAISLLFACKGQVEEKDKVYLFSAIELSTKSKDELRLIRNEVFARKGYVFKSEDLQMHFSKQAWYKPKASNDGIELNEKEKEYTDLIKQLEQQ